MKTHQMIQSRFLKKEEIDQPTEYTIKGVSLEEVGGEDERWILWLNEHEKGLVLNVTKIRTLEAMYGDDTDHWIGKRVKLTHDPSVMMAGKLVGGIKLEVFRPTAAPAKRVAAAAPAAKEFDDDIPF